MSDWAMFFRGRGARAGSLSNICNAGRWRLVQHRTSASGTTIFRC
jgi:hypothetical protein